MQMSASPEAFDEDLSDFDDFDNPPQSAKRAKKGKGSSKGKSKATGNVPMQEEGNDTASARKLQNRVAQREFRQRKLQYVKDLEARVEFLSSSKDDQLEALKAMLRGLLDENKQLRTMLQTVTAFVGDGIGGLTSKVGIKNHMDIDTFMEFVARGDRQTLITLYDNWKDRKAAGAIDTTAPGYAEADGSNDTFGKSRGSANNKNNTGTSSQRSSRANSPVNSSSGPNVKADLSRKRSRNEKSNSTTQNDSSPFERPSPQGGLAGNQNNDAAEKSQAGPSSGKSQPDKDAQSSSKSTFTPPASAAPANSTTAASMPSSAQTKNLDPPAAYRNYMELMASATAPNLSNTATNFSHSFYTQQPGPNGNTQWPNFASSASMPPGYNPSHVHSDNHSNSASNAGATNAFFFDTAEPMSMPTSSFTNEFLNQYIHTGLTPLMDPSYQHAMFPWSANGAEAQQGAPTPASSSSSMNQMPSPVNQHNKINNNQNNNFSSPHNMQSQMNAFVPQLSLAQNPLQHQQQQQPQQAHQFSAVPPPMHNPLASPRSALPSIPPGFSPDELINSNPLLAAIHIISFHLRNKAANPNYVLPPALEPTPLQCSTPHDFRLDGILHREWRTRLLTNMDYNLNDLLQDLMQSATVHPGDNLLEPANWELSESFLRKYKHTVTPDILGDSNKWRRSRGEPEIVL